MLLTLLTLLRLPNSLEIVIKPSFKMAKILQFKNLTNSYSCSIEFRKAGLFPGPQYTITGFIADGSGKKCIELEGRWDQYLNAKWLVDTTNRKTGETVEVWRITENNFVENDQYGFSKYAVTLNNLDEELAAVLLPTDSRRRLDRMYLEKGDTDSATKWKRVMEERQRADRKDRKEHWVPLWFHEEQIPTGAEAEATSSTSSTSTSSSSTHNTVSQNIWKHKGTYWKERETRAKSFADGEDVKQPTVAASITDQACDFCSYESTNNTNLTDGSDTVQDG